MSKERIHRTGKFSYYGYAKYVQEIDKNKEEYYNRVEIKKGILQKGCGSKINILL